MSGRFRPRPLSIGAKTLISHITLALAVALLACSLSYWLCFRYLQKNLMRELTAQARFIASETQVSEDGLTPPEPDVMRTYQQMSNASVLYVDASYNAYQIPFAYRGTAAPDGEDAERYVARIRIGENPDQALVARVLAGETLATIRKLQFAQGMVLFAGCPVTAEDGTVAGGVILVQPIAVFEGMSRLVRKVLVFAALLSMLLAAALALTLSRRLTRPIRVITQAARRMAEGEYGADVPASSQDEIGELGSVLSTLSNRVLLSTRRLSEERDKLELIITSIGEGILAVDRALQLVHVNPAFAELMEAASAQAALADGGEAAEALKALIRQVIGVGERREGRLTNPSGRELAAIASPFFGENGEITGAVCLLRDVSEARRMEQLQRDYVANVSHELRTPLTGIRGMVEPLLDGIIDTEAEKQECYRVIDQEAQRLQKLVGEMLDMSRLQDGRATVELEALEPVGILKAAERRMRGAAEECGVALSVEAPGRPLKCVGNEDRILQVLVIFLDNALSFTPAGGRVTLFARETAQRVVLGVKDTGVGIDPKDLPFIWERFYKADKSRLRTTGTGLGLAIAKLAVGLMNGETHVTSSPGEGAEFSFSLPIEDQQTRIGQAEDKRGDAACPS